MEKIDGGLDVLNSLQQTELTAGMDRSAKELFKNREILAVILKGVVAEYAGFTYKEIMGFIEGDSISDGTEVTAGRSPSRIVGDDKEYIALGEKTSLFDVKFRAVNPKLSGEKLLVNLHIDVEIQIDSRPGYPLEKRGLYYLARELSSQLPVAAEGTDYGSLEKCYSIWVCRDNIPKDERFSISFYGFSNTMNYGNCHNRKENYDLMNLVVIKLGDSVYNGLEGDEGYDVLRFLDAIMYPSADGGRLDTVKEYIDFSGNPDLWKEVNGMGGIGMSIMREGFEKGLKQGYEQGIDKGIEQDRGRINLLIKRLRTDNRLDDLFRSLDDPEFQEQLLEEYGL